MDRDELVEEEEYSRKSDEASERAGEDEDMGDAESKTEENQEDLSMKDQDE